MEKNNRSLGSAQEERAVRFLREQGYDIMATNFRCKAGEVDIIASEGGVLCFIEVKYRATLRAGQPEVAVNFSKQKRISRVADFYFVRYNVSASVQVRFDVVGILGEEIRLHKNAFEYIPRF